MSRDAELRIVNFHGIGVPERTLDGDEANFWISMDKFGSILDQIAVHPQRERLRITFDDGNISDLTIAAPQLLERGLSAEFFIITDRIGKTGSLSADDIRQLMQVGMGIGSHGIAHSDWSTLAASQLADELTRSKVILEEISGRPIPSAAIPFGRYNSAVLTALHEAGYEMAYSSDGGGAKGSSFLKPRASVRRDMTEAELDRILSGTFPLLARLRRTAGMAVKKWV